MRIITLTAATTAVTVVVLGVALSRSAYRVAERKKQLLDAEILDIMQSANRRGQRWAD